MPKSFKVKSVVPELSDEQVDKLVSTRFMSFESIVRQHNEIMKKEYGINEQAVGYDVTEQGVIFKYK